MEFIPQSPLLNYIIMLALVVLMGRIFEIFTHKDE